MHCPALAVWLSRQRWLPYKLRRSLIKRLYPAMLENFTFEAELFGGDGIRFRGNIVNYIDRLIYFCGAHEKYMLRFLDDYIRQLKQHTFHKTVFMDVGANVGNHVLFMAKRIDTVHAFEPYERVRKQLEENLALNNITNVIIHPVGLSNQDAVMPFYTAPDTNLGASSFMQEHKSDNYYLGDLQLRYGEDMVKEAGIDRVDILKADVEGFEKFVFEGLSDTLRSQRPLVIMELSPTTRNTLGGEKVLYALFPERYRFFYFARGNFNTGRYKLAPFDYRLTPKIEDVIACPEERLTCLGKI